MNLDLIHSDVMNSRILLVDDDRLLREVIGEFLSDKGYDVDLADSGEEALRMFSSGKYHLLLIDQDMKPINGLQLMNKIKAIDNDVFCLIMVGYANLNKVYDKLGKNNTDYIIKPFQLMELLNTLQKCI